MKGSRSQKIQWAPILVGLVALFTGVLVYLIDRPAGRIYFLNHLPLSLPFDLNTPGLLGWVGYVLPDFIHPFSFTLITAGVLGAGKRAHLFSALFWFGVNALFEIGQKFGDDLAPMIPKWFKGIPYLENTEAYFKRGTFDWFDLIAILAGAVSAWLLLTAFRFRNEKKGN